MNYIVLDLEWNQSPTGKADEQEGLPFEIIQIGAVKMNAQFETVSEFDRFVCPQTYKKLHQKIKEILNIDMKMLEAKGKPFQAVARDFLEWCGEDYIFCTWGSCDLPELQRNMRYYHVKHSFPHPFLFYDLQKLYSLCYSDGDSRVTLQHAIEEQGIRQMEEYHMAGNDARYAAKILEKLDMEKVGRYKSVDTCVIPASRKDEIYLNFGEYGKYISRGFNSRDAAASDREVRACRCFICKKTMRRIVKWFSVNPKVYYGLFSCEEHGLIKGRFRIKSTDDGQYYAVRIFKLTDNEGAEKIRQRLKKKH